MSSSDGDTDELRSFPTKRVVDDDMEIRATGGPFYGWLADRDVEEVAVKHLPAAQDWNISSDVVLLATGSKVTPHTSVQCSASPIPDVRH